MQTEKIVIQAINRKASLESKNFIGALSVSELCNYAGKLSDRLGLDGEYSAADLFSDDKKTLSIIDLLEILLDEITDQETLVRAPKVADTMVRLALAEMTTSPAEMVQNLQDRLEYWRSRQIQDRVEGKTMNDETNRISWENVIRQHRGFERYWKENGLECVELNRGHGRVVAMGTIGDGQVWQMAAIHLGFLIPLPCAKIAAADDAPTAGRLSVIDGGKTDG